MEDKKKWIQNAVGRPGALHAQLGIPEGKKIPMDILREKAKEGGLIGKRAQLAITLKGMHKK